jgi:hypothetical protein
MVRHRYRLGDLFRRCGVAGPSSRRKGLGAVLGPRGIFTHAIFFYGEGRGSRIFEMNLRGGIRPTRLALSPQPDLCAHPIMAMERNLGRFAS